MEPVLNSKGDAILSCAYSITYEVVDSFAARNSRRTEDVVTVTTRGGRGIAENIESDIDNSMWLRLDNTGAGVIEVNPLLLGNYKTDNVDL